MTKTITKHMELWRAHRERIDTYSPLYREVVVEQYRASVEMQLDAIRATPVEVFRPDGKVDRRRLRRMQRRLKWKVVKLVDNRDGVSVASSVELFLSDPAVRGLQINVDSPGGQISAGEELVQ
ncbi:hypothetical protein [Hahella ganghwensis]|uniref:hypothetical protein n=1 Tax=Hahella ganghwensis TaxID=286420 RepID=UPI0003A13EF3|nr:hypothetical protein [Hahella ganghwensis]